jgi:hypothetical protein
MSGFDRYDWIMLAVGWMFLQEILSVFDPGLILGGLIVVVISFFSGRTAWWLRNRFQGQ